jgi:hypothetical protein
MKTTQFTTRQTRTPAYNSTHKKLAVQWLNEALCFVSSLALVDSLRLRNRQLLKPAKRTLGKIRFASIPQMKWMES